MNQWPIWLAIGMGGASGALVRGVIFYLIERMSPANSEYQWAKYGPARATLVVNVFGSLLLGIIVGGHWEGLANSNDPLRIFWLTGICGALTTFSTLCADVVALAQAGQKIRGGKVLAANVVLGVSALLLGLAIAG